MSLSIKWLYSPHGVVAPVIFNARVAVRSLFVFVCLCSLLVLVLVDLVGEDGLLIFRAATADRSVEEFVVFNCEELFSFSSLLIVLSLLVVDLDLAAAAANLSLSAGNNVVDDGIVTKLYCIFYFLSLFGLTAQS